MFAPTIGLRERKKAATRSAIADAARRLGLSVGFDQVTVEAIAREADVSPRTFFNYFPSKEAAVLAPSAARWERITDVLAARPDDEGAWMALRRSLTEVITGGAPDRADWVDALLLARTDATLMAQQRNDYVRYERLLVDQVHTRMGAGKGDMRPHLIVATAVTGVRVAVHRWLDDPDALDLTELLAHAMDLIADGMLAASAGGGHR